MKNFSERYQQIQPMLTEEFSLSNVWQLPRIRKVSLNVGVGGVRTNADRIKLITEALAKITGQLPSRTVAKKSIAGFKVREGDFVGLRVTLRGKKMTDFIDRLIAVNLPRYREFTGLKSSQFDRQGNLTIGFKDQTIFYELTGEYFENPFGLSVTISISNSNPEKSLALLQHLGFPVNKS